MNKTILVVDDEVLMVDLLHRILNRHGYKVVCTSDPHEVANLLDEATPDLIILDYMMPEINGIELCEMVRSRIDTFMTPVFMLSALNDFQVVQESRSAGANAFFTKDECSTRLVRELERTFR